MKIKDRKTKKVISDHSINIKQNKQLNMSDFMMENIENTESPVDFDLGKIIKENDSLLRKEDENLKRNNYLFDYSIFNPKKKVYARCIICKGYALKHRYKRHARKCLHKYGIMKLDY